MFFFSLYKNAPEAIENFTRESSGENKKIAILLFTSDRGLCGAFNSALCKQLSVFLQDKKNTDLFLIGKKGRDFFQQEENISIIEGYYKEKEEKLKHKICEMSQVLIKKFLKEEYDEVYLAFNYFVSSINQEPRIERFLPLNIAEDPTANEKETTPAIFEPSVKQIADELIPTYLENLCYLCLLDSFAGEHASRMRVMDAATNNARDLITKLQMQYNRARQANITTELTEIISGAESV
jgi:F-type H+-transporting ATPase subunit gamma